MKRISYIFFIFSATMMLCAMDEITAKYFELAKQFEVREMTTPPKWALRKEPPLFQIAWLTDQHITDVDSTKISHDALVYIRDVVQPAAVVITGDNIGTYPRGFKDATPTLQRQRDFREMLKKSLGEMPCWVIPGDNWPKDFEKVFGATHYSFDFGGFHFIFNTVDVTGQSNGCSRFGEATWKWLQTDLAAHPDQPIIYLQHEPCLPPSFLDAPKLSELFGKTPQLLLALAGHLHLDLEFRSQHWTQWVGPSVGRSHRPGFKVLSFYPNQIVATSIEWDSANRHFRPVNKFQRVKIPEALRGGLHRPEPGETRSGYSELPPAPMENDPRLDELARTVMENVKAFGMRLALQRIIPE